VVIRSCGMCYDTVLYDTVLYIMISYLFVCLFILYDINYCMFDMYDMYNIVRVMRPPCMLNVVLFTPCVLAHLLACVCLWKCQQQNDRQDSARTVWNLLAAAKVRRECVLKSTGRTLSVVVLFGCVAIVHGHVVELFRKSTAERERCWSTSDDFFERTVSAWTLLLIVGCLLGACYFVVDALVQGGPSARRFPGVSWSVNGSGRVIPSHLIGSYRFIWSRLLNANTPSGQFIALFVIVRRRGRSLSFHAGRSCCVVKIRLTARLQSLPLARCWPACFALFSSFSPLFRFTLTVVKWFIVCIFRTLSYKRTLRIVCLALVC